MRWLVIEPQLPWDADGSQQKNYWLLLFSLLGFGTIFSWMVSQAVLPEKTLRTKAEISERFVKLVLEQKKKIVTPSPPKPQEMKKVSEKKTEKVKPKEVEKELKPVIKKNKKVIEITPKGNRKDAIEKAKQHLAVFDALADLRESTASQKILDQKNLSQNVAKAKTIDRQIFNNQAKASSGGVNLTKASHNIGGLGLEGDGSRQVSSNLAQKMTQQITGARANGKALRPSDNIEKFMDNNKSSFFTLYNRALRKQPDMQGDVIFRITIQPNGAVSDVVIVSSQLNNPELEKKILTKIRTIQFGAMNVETWHDNYRISFIPT